MPRYHSKMSPIRVNPKFTRGEKCLFVHLFMTILIILLMIITYFIHVYIVKHDGNEMFRVYRRSFRNQETFNSNGDTDRYTVGVLYTNASKKVVCNTLLLRQEWSIAPAHCIVIRSDPNMAHLLNTWTVMYLHNQDQIMETTIKRQIIHSQFNRDDFENNIGLIEHFIPILLREHLLVRNQFRRNENMHSIYIIHATIFGWNVTGERRGDTPNKIVYPSNIMSKENCNSAVSPIINKLRDNELCATITYNSKEVSLHHGAILVSQETGFFSWGDKKSRGIPYIFLNINYYENWFLNVINI